jgi:hypothetical protein
MKDLSIFISYSNEDSSIATALSNLLQQAFGPSCETFLDKYAISFGSEIKDSVLQALDRADVLIAIIAGAQPTSALSWPASEITRFSAGWDPKFQGARLHGNKVSGDLIGRVFIIYNGHLSFGPESGKRPVQLGISEQLLSDYNEKPNDITGIRGSLMANSEVQDLMTQLESLVSSEQDYEEFFSHRTKTLVDLVTDFKFAAYQALKRRIRGISKPSRQLIVHYTPDSSEHNDSLPENAKVLSIGGASDIFGKHEDDTQLFTKTSDTTPGAERYETSWRKFKDSLLENKRHGAYWCGVLEQAVIGAKRQGAKLDPNLILTSADNERYRVIATTVTTFFDGDAEVSLYLIPGLKRRDRGDQETTRLLNGLTLVCRFRFAFLEKASTYYWRNFESASEALRTKVKDLLMELDYLKSEAAHADLEKPGNYENLVSNEELTQMSKRWKTLEFALRETCNAAIQGSDKPSDESSLTQQVVAHLKTLFEQVKPFNDLLGAAIAKKLWQIFGGNDGDE